MEEISEAETPFPYGEGILYNIQYFVKWEDGDIMSSQRHINWIRSIYQNMTPYVSKNPRGADWGCRLGLQNGVISISRTILRG